MIKLTESKGKSVNLMNRNFNYLLIKKEVKEEYINIELCSEYKNSQQDSIDSVKSYLKREDLTMTIFNHEENQAIFISEEEDKHKNEHYIKYKAIIDVLK